MTQNCQYCLNFSLPPAFCLNIDYPQTSALSVWNMLCVHHVCISLKVIYCRKWHPPFFFKLEDSCFTMLWWSLPYINTSQYSYIYCVYTHTHTHTMCLVAQSCLTLCDPMDCSCHATVGHGDGDSPGQNTGVGCHALLRGILPTQGSNLGIPHCRQILYHLIHQESPRILEWVAYPVSRGSS